LGIWTLLGLVFPKCGGKWVYEKKMEKFEGGKQWISPPTNNTPSPFIFFVLLYLSFLSLPSFSLLLLFFFWSCYHQRQKNFNNKGCKGKGKHCHCMLWTSSTSWAYTIKTRVALIWLLPLQLQHQQLHKGREKGGEGGGMVRCHYRLLLNVCGLPKFGKVWHIWQVWKVQCRFGIKVYKGVQFGPLFLLILLYFAKLKS
jgi:hypothetical protein